MAAPATTPEGRENQMIALATDLVERRLREGTASAQETVHFLKLGSTRERLEQKRLDLENRLTEAKTEHMASLEQSKELYEQALSAMRMYSGNQPIQGSDDDGD